MKAKFVINPGAAEKVKLRVALFNIQKASDEERNVCHNTNQYAVINGDELDVTGERQALGSQLLNQLVEMTTLGELILIEMDSAPVVNHNPSLHGLVDSDYRLPLNKTLSDIFNIIPAKACRAWLQGMVTEMYPDGGRIIIRPKHNWAQPSLCASAEQWLEAPEQKDIKAHLLAFLTIIESVRDQMCGVL